MFNYENLIRKLGNRPELSLILGATTGAYLHFHKGIGLDFTKVQNEYIFTERLGYSLAALISVTMFGVIYGFLTTTKRLKSPLVKNYFKHFFMPPYDSSAILQLKKDKDIEDRIKILEDNKDIYEKNTLPNLKIAALYFKLNKMDDGIDYFKKSLVDLKEDDFEGFIEFDKRLYSLFVRKKNTRRIEKNPNDIESYFNLINLGLLRGDFDKIGLYWDKVSNLETSSKLDFNILFSLFLDALESNSNLKNKYEAIGSNSDKQWLKTLEIIINSQDLEDRFVKLNKRSRNSILEYGPTKFLSNTFVFKRDKKKINEETNKEEIKKGFFTNLALYQANKEVKEDSVKLVRSLGLFENVNEHIYDISQRKPIKNLEDVFCDVSDDDKTKILISALKNQRNLHKLGNRIIKHDKDGNYLEANYKGEKVLIRISNYDYKANLNRRLFSRVGFSNEGNEFSELIINELKPFTDKFNTLINGDLALPNILEDGTIIDFEKACYGNPVIDIVTTLEDTKNKELNKKIILNKAYLSYLDKTEKEYLEESYKWHSVFISACQVGSKMNQNDIYRAREFLNQVLEESKDNVKDRFVKYIRSIDNSSGKALQKSL